jgi:hypothetical protein
MSCPASERGGGSCTYPEGGIATWPGGPRVQTAPASRFQVHASSSDCGTDSMTPQKRWRMFRRLCTIATSGRTYCTFSLIGLSWLRLKIVW